MSGPTADSWRRPSGGWHIAYLAAVGLGGWLVVLGATFSRPDSLSAPSFDWLLLTCILLAGAARLSAFRAFRRVRIALDSAFYIAARFMFGSVAVAWLVLLALSVDAAIRLLRGTAPMRRSQAPASHILAYLVFNGGLPGGLMIAVGAAFGDRPLLAIADGTLAWQVALFSVAFLVVHYLLAGGASWVQGAGSATLWRNFFLPVVSAELILLPLSLAMVMAFKHQGPWFFFLIASTGLLFDMMFRRGADVTEDLRRRLKEISALNRVAQIIAKSSDRATLLQELAVVTVELVGAQSHFMVGLVDETGKGVAYEWFDGRGVPFKQLVAPREAGLSGWVMRNRKALLLTDVPREFHMYCSDDSQRHEHYHSWLSVPLLLYDEVVGVLSVQSEEPRAFSLEHVKIITNIADQTVVSIENARLYQMATVDSLTGLYVRRYFEQRLIEEWDRAARFGSALAVGMFDLDHFKKLNDTYGHQVGDQALRAAGKVIRRTMRSFDLAARYGGEEFIFILPRTTLDEAQVVAERMRHELEELRIRTPGGDEVRVTASIGLTGYPSQSVQDPQDLIGMADDALYQAKETGRNRVVCYQNAEPS